MNTNESWTLGAGVGVGGGVGGAGGCPAAGGVVGVDAVGLFAAGLTLPPQPTKPITVSKRQTAANGRKLNMGFSRETDEGKLLDGMSAIAREFAPLVVRPNLLAARNRHVQRHGPPSGADRRPHSRCCKRDRWTEPCSSAAAPKGLYFWAARHPPVSSDIALPGQARRM